MAVPPTSPVTGDEVPAHFIHANSLFFQDVKGRSVLLRGVNLSGSSKAPPNHPSQDHTDFWEDAKNGGNSFIGTPLNLEDGSAEVHLARLRGWGFNCLRYVVTWESLEREGPGKYDFEFMDYTIEVLRRCKAHGFYVYMDPHQDVWSRFSGGSGAPYWTLPLAGFSPFAITSTLSAVVHSEYPSASSPNPAALPAMIWSTNYSRLLIQTMFTLFYAGRDFAPLCIVDGVNVQDYLQSHYISAFSHLAERIHAAGNLEDVCVLGWDSMNEPGEGYIGIEDLGQFPKSQAMKKGPTPTSFDGMLLGMGRAVEVENWSFGSMGPQRDGTVVVDPRGVKVWATEEDLGEVDGESEKWGWKRDKGWKVGTCIWAQHGVWEPSLNQLLVPDYFSRVAKSESPDEYENVIFISRYWRPHFYGWAKMVRQQHPEAILFINGPVFHPLPELDEEVLCGRVCVSQHYYDGLTLITRHWNWFNADALGILRGKYSSVLQGVRIGEPAIRKCLQQQLGVLKSDTAVLGNYPSLIGEIGIPYDMDGKKAYGYVDGGKGEGDYSSQMKALDASLNACDGENVLNYTIWNYCVDNSHEWGDNWNLEDLSLWSEDDTVKSRQRRDDQGGDTERDVIGYQSSTSVNQHAPSFNKMPYPKESRTSNLAVPSSSTLSSSNSCIALRRPNAIPEITSEILVDGSRALGAFCRPYPVATVGRPLRIDFDIKSSLFTLCIEVNDDELFSAGPDAFTEVYLPWVHYRCLNNKSSSTQSSEPTSSSSSKNHIDFNPSNSVGPDILAESGSSTSVASGDNSRDVSPSSTINKNSIGVGSKVLTKSLNTSSLYVPSSVSAPTIDGLELDVDIKVTGGRTELDGQVLRWYYSSALSPMTPASSSYPKSSLPSDPAGINGTMMSNDLPAVGSKSEPISTTSPSLKPSPSPNASRTYTLTVRRRTGKGLNLAGTLESKSWFDQWYQALSLDKVPVGFWKALDPSQLAPDW